MVKIRVRGCTVSAEPVTFICAAALCCMRGSGTIMCALAAALVHEAGHLLAMKALNMKLRAIKIRAVGVTVETDDPERERRGWVLVSLAGGIANLLLSAVCFLLGARKVCFVSLLLGMLSLLPASPLDGGEALFSVLRQKYCDRTASRAVTIASFLILLPLTSFGVYVLLRSRGNYSLLLLSLWIFSVILIRTLKKDER